jgi:hypothetical protein
MRSGLAFSVLGAVCLCRCAVFDEGMRVGAPPSEAGADSSGSPGTPVEAGGSSSGGAGDGSSGPLVCGATVGPGPGAGSCPGQGGRAYVGRSEREPNDDPESETLERDVLVCGQIEGTDNDQFEFPIAQGECFEVAVQIEGEVEFHLQGVDTDERHETSQHLSFVASAAGTFEITIVRNGKGGSYRILRR